MQRVERGGEQRGGDDDDAWELPLLLPHLPLHPASRVRQCPRQN
jgi:hypothetical protein